MCDQISEERHGKVCMTERGACMINVIKRGEYGARCLRRGMGKFK
jgi:hypothetical protein